MDLWHRLREADLLAGIGDFPCDPARVERLDIGIGGACARFSGDNGRNVLLARVSASHLDEALARDRIQILVITAAGRSVGRAGRPGRWVCRVRLVLRQANQRQ